MNEKCEILPILTIFFNQNLNSVSFFLICRFPLLKRNLFKNIKIIFLNKLVESYTSTDFKECLEAENRGKIYFPKLVKEFLLRNE